MKCLAVNTANTTLSVALTAGQKVLYRFDSAETRDQGNLLLWHVRQGMDRANMTFDDLELLAVVTGPGSFTGIRIGLAALRGLALAARLPLIGISSFDLFAAQKPGLKNIVAVESWRSELYFCEEGRDPVNAAPEIFAKSLAPDGAFLISGDARQKLTPFLPGAKLHDADPAAPEVAQLAIRRFKASGTGERPVPFYLREADVTISSRSRKTEGAQQHGS